MTQKTVSFERGPAETSRDAVRGSLDSYIKNYGLLLQRLLWSTENENPNLPEDDLNRYISNLVEPLAFNGETQIAKEMKSNAERIFNERNAETAVVNLKTEIKSTGNYGGLLKSRNPSSLKTTASTTVDHPVQPVKFREDDWLDAQVQLQEWKDERDTIYANLKSGQVLHLVLVNHSDYFEISFKVNP